MTFFLQIEMRLVKWNDYVMIKVFTVHENMPMKWERRKTGKNK